MGKAPAKTDKIKKQPKMKKTSILLLLNLVVLLLTSCKNEIIKNDLVTENLKGKIKSITTSSIENEQLIPESMFKYNLDGYKIYQEEYSNYDQYPQINTEILRDKNNTKTEEIINYKYSYDSSLDTRNTKKYNYNKKNKLIEIIEFDFKNKIISNTEIKYDEKENIISENTSNDYAPNNHTYKYKYDGDEIIEKNDKNLITKNTFIHNYENNKETSTIYKDEKNKISSTKKYIYDEKNNLSEEVTIDGDGTLSSSLKYSYDEKNNLIETKQTYKGELNSIIKYEYDEIGNWIKETTSFTNSETIIRTRKIEYYSENEKENVKINNSKTTETEKPAKTEEKVNVNDNLKTLNEIQLTLLDATLKKAKIYLGEPDKEEHSFGHLTKGFAIYYNAVSNENGNPKHLVLFLRMQDRQWGNDAKIEEIYSVEDGQKACFGIHCIMIKNQTIYTNALDLIYDRGYEKL